MKWQVPRWQELERRRYSRRAIKVSINISPEQLLRRLYDATVSAADPAQCLPAFLPPPPRGRTLVLGAGKAAAAMAAAVEQHWQGSLSGLAITRYGHGMPCRQIEVIEAGHPAPDAVGEAAARRALQMASALTADDLLLCLLSGGGSALMSLPARGLSLVDKQSVTRALLRSGASITEINSVRKHLSAIKGGRLALAAGAAQVVSLIISDVPGDDLSVIASGPTVADASTRLDALAILRSYDIVPPLAVRAWLESERSETPKPGAAGLAKVQHRLIATPRMALESACAAARSAGVSVQLLGDAIEGDARQCGLEHAQLALQCQAQSAPAQSPCVLLSGGETTVKVVGSGRGGRNAEFLLSLALGVDAAPGLWAIACDTDGIDGTEDNAGAVLRPDTLARGRACGLDAAAMLANNDAYSYFAALGDLVVTGPTRTNVNDFRAIYIQ
jgi:glycerate 2-kinase